MNPIEKQQVKVAILDLYDGVANQGMRCIREILNQYGDVNNLDLTWDEFNVRQQNSVPDLSYDMYISSGGPGSPLDSEGSQWEAAYFGWLKQVERWNNETLNQQKKHVFFICHSFQLACRHYRVANVCKRKSTAFGVFPVHLMSAGRHEEIFHGMRDPFFVVDSRDYQVIQPDRNKMEEMGAAILAIEKERPHVNLERAVMAIRFNEFMIGTQFHPEADAIGMSMYLQTEEKKKTVIENYGEPKWKSMIEHLNDPDKIMRTYAHILPNFLNNAVEHLQAVA